MRSLKYFLIYITPIFIISSLFTKNGFVYLAVLFFFGLVPAIELFTKGSEKNLTTIEEEIAKEDKVYDWLLWALVPAQYITLFVFLYHVQQADLSFVYKLGATIAFGISCGVLGINAAHELGHRSSKLEQTMSKALLLTSMYMHFFIEHNRGHHFNVSTDEDPASSRYGESVYAFYFRTVIGSYTSAWSLERKRLGKKGYAFWSWHNEMIWYHILQLGLLLVILFFFGWQALAFYSVSAAMGIALLETVNYIEHYGLRRQKNGDKYERTMPIHSWNSNHPIGRLILFELSRHSDHHYMASRKYQLLRHHNNSPQMPTGYPGMMLLALMPPLWFKVMNKRINDYKQTEAGMILA